MVKSKAVPKRHIEGGSKGPVAGRTGDIVEPKKKRKTEGSGLDNPVLVRFLGEVVDHPHVFLLLDKNPQIPVLAQSVTKILHDASAGVAMTGRISLGPLKELLVEGFDAEQVWEEIQLRNDPLLRSATNLLRDPQVSWPFTLLSSSSSFSSSPSSSSSLSFSAPLLLFILTGCFEQSVWFLPNKTTMQNFLGDTVAPEGKKRQRTQESDVEEEEEEEEEGNSQAASEEGLDEM